MKKGFENVYQQAKMVEETSAKHETREKLYICLWVNFFEHHVRSKVEQAGHTSWNVFEDFFQKNGFLIDFLGSQKPFLESLLSVEGF